MAMIKCPECRKKISSLAASCPNCGCPISPESISTKSDKKRKENKIENENLSEPRYIVSPHGELFDVSEYSAMQDKSSDNSTANSEKDNSKIGDYHVSVVEYFIGKSTSQFDNANNSQELDVTETSIENDQDQVQEQKIVNAFRSISNGIKPKPVVVAFFFPLAWLLYRKMYLYALFYFILYNGLINLIPYSMIGIKIIRTIYFSSGLLIGSWGYKLYYSHMQMKLGEKFKNVDCTDNVELQDELARLGGTSKVSIILYILALALNIWLLFFWRF